MARDRSLAGIFWSLLNIGTSVLLPLGVLVFFTRTLPPLEIGLVGLAVACVEIIKCFGLPGLYEALLQQKEDVRRHDETVLAMLLLVVVFGNLFVQQASDCWPRWAGSLKELKGAAWYWGW